MLIHILLLLVLQGCSSRFDHKFLLNNTVQYLNKNYKIDYGHLIIRYDLAAFDKSNYFYAKDFAKIINDNNYNKAFLYKISSKIDIQNLNKEAKLKEARIKKLLLKLNKKYHFFSKSDLCLLQNKGNIIYSLSTIDKIISIIPLMAPQYNQIITSHYGMRHHPIKRKKRFHYGIDFKGCNSAPIYASADGIVMNIGKDHSYGNFIEIKHSSKFKTKYAHLKKIYVKKGDKVIRGQIVALQGNSGNSTKEHLHFELWLNGKAVNPYDFLSHSL